MPVLCQQAAQHDEVLQYMFLTSLRNIVPEQLIQWKLCDIKTRWHCLFCDQGDRSKGQERRTKSSSYPGRWDLMILCLTNMLRDICL